MLVTDIVSAGLIKEMLRNQVAKGNQKEDVESQLQKYKSMSATEKKALRFNRNL